MQSAFSSEDCMANLIRPEIMSLRQAIRAAAPPIGEMLPLGIAAMDAALGGGLACGALHEIAAPRESEMAAAAGFALALAARRRTPVLWIAEDMALAESGAPHGPGLDAIGLAPERLLTVAAPKTRDVLWVMEEALRCRALGAVIGEIRGGADLVATRRLSLAVGHAGCGTLGLLLRAAPSGEPSAAATRWVVGAAASAPAPHGIGPPRFAAHLTRNRRGHLGSWIVEWKSGGFVFATHSESVSAPALDRPHRAERSAA
jgi:protein ImuA